MPLKESEKEQTKLLATALNTAGVNTAIVGLVVPMVAFLYRVPSAPSAEHLVPACFVWPLAGFVLPLVRAAHPEESGSMTGAQIFALYGAPWIIVLGGGLLTWQNRVEMRRAHKRGETAAFESPRPPQQERANAPPTDAPQASAPRSSAPAPRRNLQPLYQRVGLTDYKAEYAVEGDMVVVTLDGETRSAEVGNQGPLYRARDILREMVRERHERRAG